MLEMITVSQRANDLVDQLLEKLDDGDLQVLRDMVAYERQENKVHPGEGLQQIKLMIILGKESRSAGMSRRAFIEILYDQIVVGTEVDQ